jgi:hypothetical protein
VTSNSPHCLNAIFNNREKKQQNRKKQKQTGTEEEGRGTVQLALMEDRLVQLHDEGKLKKTAVVGDRRA